MCVRQPAILALGISLVLAFFVFLTNGMVPFSNNGHCDPWHYFGYFYLNDHFDTVGASRTYSRLPATIIGFALTRLLHSVMADYAHYVVLLVLTVGPVFLMARRLYGILPAVVAAAFLGTSGIVIGVLSVTYTGPSLAWSTLAAFTALGASLAERLRLRAFLLVATGFLLATSIVGHLYSLTFNFVVPLYAVRWTSLSRRSIFVQLPSISGYLTVGAILAIVVWGPSHIWCSALNSPSSATSSSRSSTSK